MTYPPTACSWPVPHYFKYYVTIIFAQLTTLRLVPANKTTLRISPAHLFSSPVGVPCLARKYAGYGYQRGRGGTHERKAHRSALDTMKCLTGPEMRACMLSDPILPMVVITVKNKESWEILYCFLPLFSSFLYFSFSFSFVFFVFSIFFSFSLFLRGFSLFLFIFYLSRFNECMHTRLPPVNRPAWFWMHWGHLQPQLGPGGSSRSLHIAHWMIYFWGQFELGHDIF